jgi:ubiquinone/menaquinone biosynthesis C-methylase UbiE
MFVQNFEFDAMSQRKMYAACRQWLIERSGIGERSTVVDLGCGSGILIQQLLEQVGRAPTFRVIAIDPSEWELSIARSRISDPRVTFIQGIAQDALKLVKIDVDAVLLCNVLHQIPVGERRSVIEAAFQLVRPGGMVAANTLFYDGGIGPDTHHFYMRWMAEVRQYLQRAGIPWGAPASTSIALQRLSPRQHFELFEAIGFENIEVEEVQFYWTADDWEALSNYSVFIRGALSPDIPLEIGSRALTEGVHATYRALGLESVRRGWLHCAARRPASERLFQEPAAVV